MAFNGFSVFFFFLIINLLEIQLIVNAGSFLFIVKKIQRCVSELTFQKS